VLDSSTPAGRRAADRLVDDLIAWLTTVAPGGQPQASPVWFLWADGEFIVFSRAGTPRERNIRANPRVSINLDGDGEGGNIVTIEGEARIDPGTGGATEHPAFLAKYAALLASYEWTPARFAADYPLLVRIRPTRFRVG
jgi:PPOX class probable F420-dependent enzyme